MGGYNNAKLKYIAFANEYLNNGYNATDAHQKVYPNYSRVSSYTHAADLLKRPIVKEIIDKARDKAMREMEVSEKRIIQELAAIAFADTADMYDEEGNVKNIHDMPENVRRSIDVLSKKRHRYGTDITVSRNPKLKALELLGRNLKMFTDKVEVDGEVNHVEQILEARKRANPNAVTVTVKFDEQGIIS